jgi:hypothetical protein
LLTPTTTEDPFPKETIPPRLLFSVDAFVPQFPYRMAWLSVGSVSDDLVFVNALDAAATEYKRIIAESQSR